MSRPWISSRRGASCLLALLVSSACASGGPLARVDGRPIGAEELEASFGRRHSGHLSFLLGEAEVRAALEREIEDELLLQEAERLGLDSRQEIREVVAAKRRQSAVRHLLEVEVERPAQPSEEEIRSAWERFTDELIVVRQIVVPTREEIDEIAAELASGVPFDRLARERSRVGSRRADGLLPPIGWGTMEAAWDEAVFALEPGAVTAPFESGGAWEIVRMVERRPVERPRLDEARERIKAILLRRRLQARRLALTDRLFAEYEVEFHVPPEPARYLAALAAEEPTTVASWRGGRLTAREVARKIDLEALGGLSAERAAYLLEDGVRSLVFEPLLGLEAERRGYTRLPEIVEEGRRLRDELMLGVLAHEFIFRDLEVSDEQIEAWYEAHPEELLTDERRRVAQLLLAGEEEAVAARRRIAEGESFDDLLRELAPDAWSSPRRGELGWVTKEETPPDWDELWDLAVGEVSRPLRSDVGWHLVQVLEIEPSRRPALDEVRDEVRSRVLREERRKRRASWVETLRAAARIEVDDRAVERFVRSRRDG